MTVSPSVELPDNLPACHAVIRRQAEIIVECTGASIASTGTWRP